MAVNLVAPVRSDPVILSAIAEKLKRRPEDDFKGRQFEAPLILQAVSCQIVHPMRQRRSSHVAAAIWIAALLAIVYLPHQLDVMAGKSAAIIGYARTSTHEQEAGLY